MQHLTSIRVSFGLFAALVSSGALAAEPPLRWKQTGTLPAPEAFQAAAADEKHIYAITSDRVARYDRLTRERVAVSTGAAEHLNSGFLWEGKLYCAHSNYPARPERSEIKVLDLDSMALATFKDFGNFGGSLTWAVRHDGHWWCNFARYGAENGQTFLVKFADDWREVGRWTYPPEVIGELGRNSISGGLWLEDHLLTTGHDDPVLFRLELPREGSVLRLVGKEAVSFTGQGFAVDPHTGGLVGIHRAKRQIVFVSAVNVLHVVTYNIHHGEGTDGKVDIERIAAVIKQADPDLVALQEVDQKVKRSGGVDQPAELARLTGLHVVFGGNIPLEGGEYGNAVLSRFPIKRHENHLLPRTDGGEQRGVLEVELEVPGKERLILLATHFDHRRPDAQRIDSAKVINALASKYKDEMVVLAGDLNDVPESNSLAQLLSQWKTATSEPMPTYPVQNANRQIDYVLVYPASRWRKHTGKVLDEAVASDHRALWVELIPIRAER
jgi:endonuclease/exonuclease/phosphatase family metal-dependent hydrolase